MKLNDLTLSREGEAHFLSIKSDKEDWLISLKGNNQMQKSQTIEYKESLK